MYDVKIAYLNKYTIDLKRLKNDLLNTQDRYNVVADLEQVEELVKAIDELKVVLENLPLD